MKNASENNNINPIEGIHYYLEHGYYVFTERYHLERGYCCRSGCRHCPYGFKKSKSESIRHQTNK